MTAWPVVSGSITGSKITPWYQPILGMGGNFSAVAENIVQSVMRSSYTFSGLYIVVPFNNTPAGFTFKFRKNGADGNQGVSVPATTTGTFEDTTNSDSVVDGDLVNYQKLGGDGLTDVMVTIASMLCVGTKQIFIGVPVSASNNTNINAGTTVYFGIFGSSVSGATTTTEGTRTYIFPRAITLSNFRIAISINTLDVITTARTRKNFGNGAQSVSIGAGATGVFEDAVNTDSIVANDIVAIQFVVPAGTGFIRADPCQLLGSTTVWRLLANGFSNTIGTAIKYFPLEGAAFQTIEANAQAKLRASTSFRDLVVVAQGNISDTAQTVGLRIDGVTSALAISVPAATSGTFTDTDVVDAASGSLVNYIGTATLSGSFSAKYITMEAIDGPAAATAIQDMLGMGVIPFDR